MSEKKKILEALRMRMRRDNITYGLLAKKLSVSEVSVKRYFSEERLSLDTLDDMCGALGATLEELLTELKSVANVQRDTFNPEQESALAEDEFLFILFFLVARGSSFDDIEKRFAKNKTAMVIKGLRELEALELIFYPSNSELRTRVSPNAHIRPDGPLWKKYSNVGIREFFDCAFAKSDEYFKLSLGYLSEESARNLKKRFELLEDEIKTLLAIERATERGKQRKRFYWIATSFRPMEASVLEIIAEKSKILSESETKI